MNYRSFTALGLVLSLLFSAGAADAAAKKSEAANKKILQRLLKKNKNSPAMTLKSGSKGGMQVLTDAAENNKKNKNEKNPAAKNEQKNSASKNAAKNAQEKSMLVEKNGRAYFLGTELPEDYQEIRIFGEAEATQKQAVAAIKDNNPKVRLACSVEKLVELYWQEAEREGVRPDLAIAQSMLETGSYAYGGDVEHNQNNFCGLGTTGNGVKGATFKTPELGVRAHIQHLLAYSQKKRPSTKIVDPRYDLAHNIRLERGLVDTWYGLNGTWAMGSLYCEKIMATYQKILSMPGGSDKKDKKKEKKDKKEKQRKSMRERVQELLKEND